MSKIDSSGPAFPFSYETRDQYDRETVHVMNGMSLRDWLAGMAMSGQLGGEPGSHLVPVKLASESYAFADAMLAERKKGGEA